MISELARAKVNLCLHVVGRRDDGYHLLDSLIVFPALGDRIEAEPARAGLGLAIDGPFGDMLDTGADNLVMRAAAKLRDALREPRGAALRLTKSLPVASGIGGGSADAAATLRALASLWERSPEPDALAALALSIGADVPACLASPNPVWMRGIGERVSPAPPPPPCWMTLANAGVDAPTPAVFKALTRKENPPAPAPAAFADWAAFSEWFAATRNDLAPPAIALHPVVAETIAALDAGAPALPARMSGSGATCFALHRSEAAALGSAAEIARAQPGWWAAAAPVGG